MFKYDAGLSTDIRTTLSMTCGSFSGGGFALAKKPKQRGKRVAQVRNFEKATRSIL
jgi:hypothetical protein